MVGALSWCVHPSNHLFVPIEPDDTNLLDTKVSNELALKSNLNPNASSFTSVIYRKSTYVDYLLPNSSTSSMLDGLFFNQLCTLHMDMTYDDRVFFGVHNFYGLKQQLSLHQCNIDFAAPDNKVSLFGGLANVQSMAEVLSRHSPLALQIEFRFYTPDLVEHIKSRATFFYGRYETAFKVFITYHQVKADTVLFSFLTNRSCWRNLYEVMALFKYEYELTRYGEFSHVMSSTLQLPSNRKDITGRGNVHIEEIRQKTKTDIDIVRLEEYPQYPFDNVTIKGQRFQDVINARLLLLERFVYTLIFQVPMCDTRLLVECISKLGHDLKSINIIIEPSSSTIYKVVSITGNQPNLGKLFALRNQLAAQYAH